MEAFTFKPVNILDIEVGDIVLHTDFSGEQKERTVTGKDLKHGGFCGTTLFGDSYRLGTKPILKGFYNDPLKNKDSEK